MATAQEMLDLYTQAEAAVLAGQSVRMGDRQLTRADLEQIRAGRREWQARVDAEARRGRAGWANADFGGTT
ncbi:primosomal replication protein PriB/PriC domain protein [Pseudoxanthomonas jiangsuensis]|uniref:primosomal replication protein PriB/PriC domain protein n=1 Tax=Pseudoxanthomonas jiangsuensis TaxID=619688 RepID=UPI001390B455|nr:primosomal replication protein PriB/PriC domain protein [Pseudoxanthomonas jiangsuensis]KAF1697981.1 primosomal replication protein PriB/PriC domain protein [Pseudoxanthomonas jiangsuensis]